MRKAFVLVAVAATVAAPALAHDFWLQPAQFWAMPGVAVPAVFFVGHGPLRQRSDIDAGRMTVFRSVGPGGLTNRIDDLTLGKPDRDTALAFATPGTHVVFFGTNNVHSELPALRFNDYVTAEGITPIISQRAAKGATAQPGREFYSRRGKALIQVGPPSGAPQPQVTRPVGLGLEIVPLLNPYALGNAHHLPVQIYYQGRPLAGATVKLTDLAADAEPAEKHVTDKHGLTSFKARRSGQWQMNVVWSQPLSNNPAAEFLTTFSSLSFGFPGAGPRR